MLIAVLAGFLVALAAPWLCRPFGRYGGWALGLAPAGLFAYYASLLPQVNAGEVIAEITPWIPSLGIDLTFRADGLSLLFALLITGIGFFVVVYAGKYLEGHRDLPRLYLLVLAFMASMLGLVTSSNLIALFIFWELTSITSYLLIGFNHEDDSARKSAQQGLFVTVGGGLALMTGFIVLASIAGSYELSVILSSSEAIRGHSLYLPMLLLILAGAFTKSAQVPFHFWLPNAMAAPTPISAYLHSATMVKAGVYLVARLYPGLGDTDAWRWTLGLFGAATMVIGIFMAVRSTGIKRVLAYSTVMALGTLVMLIGVGTEKAMAAAVTFILAHALYKATLFLVAGILDHEAGCKDFLQVGGLRRAMPYTALFAGLAALSLAGILPFFGFIAKEMLLEATLGATALGGFLTGATVLSAIMVVAVAGIVGIRPWFGPPVETPKSPHEAPIAMLLGPALMAIAGLVLGLAPSLAEANLLKAAASAAYGESVVPKLMLWHGINLPLGLSLLSIALGALLYWRWDAVRSGAAGLNRLVGPERLYGIGWDGIVRLSEWQTRIIQNGYLRNYLMAVFVTTIGLLALALFADGRHASANLDLSDLRPHEIVIAAVLIAGALVATLTSSRLGSVVSLGAVGFCVTLVYILFSAPDLGITQILVEMLTVILLVLVLFRLPRFLELTSTWNRARDFAIALCVGGTVTFLMLLVISTRYFDSISEFFVAESYPQGKGRNIVNVILVDFRALDTMGEIAVLGLAAIGVYAMIHLRAEKHT